MKIGPVQLQFICEPIVSAGTARAGFSQILRGELTKNRRESVCARIRLSAREYGS
jgi:hypothetical protein